jgi:hypothetical protein
MFMYIRRAVDISWDTKLMVFDQLFFCSFLKFWFLFGLPGEVK